MPHHKDPERVRTGSQGGLQSWVNTDAVAARHERMRHVRENSPASDTYWAKKLGFDPDRLTADQLKQIKTARKLYFAELRIGSVRATKLNKAKRLRARAAEIEAEQGVGDAS
ncbi:MAG: hypothetical protein WBZ37_25080 [Mycobacterium sp.]